MLDKIIKYGLYSLVFLLPLFFLPRTVSQIALNKEILLSLFVFLLLILWMLKIMIKGKLNFAWGKITKSLILLFIILGISTALSGSKIQSFWGTSFEPDTFYSFILYILVFFLFANLIKKDSIFPTLAAFLVGSGVLAALFLIQIFKPTIFPWDFAQSAGFNPIGSVQALAVFLGGAFVILIAVLNNIKLQRFFKILGGIVGILLFIAIFLVNYWVVWLGIAFGLGIIIFSKLKNISRNQPSSAEISGPAEQGNPLKPLLLPLFIFILALVFIFLKLPIGNVVNLPVEISPTHKATIDIAIKTLKEGPKNFILGSGPATFGYQYSLHRGTGPNLTDFWQVRFDQGATAFLTFLTTLGVLGSLAVLLMIFVFLWQGPKTQLTVFVGGVYYLVCGFFYPINLSLLFVVFLILGLFESITGEKKEFLFTQSPQKAFFIMLIGVFLIVGSILGLYNVSRKYAGALAYAEGLSLINAQTPKLNEGIQEINKAATLDAKDVYFRDLSQAFLLKIQELLNNQELPQAEKQKTLQQIVSNAELSAKAACQVNPKNSLNWLQLGSIYENLASINIEGAADLSLLNYQKAGELDPKNPLTPLNIGRVYKSMAEIIQIQIALLEQAEKKDEEAISKLQESYDKNLELAIGEFQKSTDLKNNFSAAYYLMAQTYEAQNRIDLALENYQIVLQLEPGNEEMVKKIEELSK